MFLALFTDSLTSVQSTSSKLRPSEILTRRKFRICVKACGNTLRVYSFHAARRSLLSLAPRTTIPAMKGDDAARVKLFQFFRKMQDSLVLECMYLSILIYFADNDLHRWIRRPSGATGQWGIAFSAIVLQSWYLDISQRVFRVLLKWVPRLAKWFTTVPGKRNFGMPMYIAWTHGSLRATLTIY